MRAQRAEDVTAQKAAEANELGQEKANEAHHADQGMTQTVKDKPAEEAQALQEDKGDEDNQQTGSVFQQAGEVLNIAMKRVTGVVAE